jgi:L-2,4-diaminobutyrate transaminase
MDHKRNLTLEEMDRLSLLHPLTSIADHEKNGPVIYSNAKGVRMNDQTGRDLIDMGAGLWCVNVGYGRQELADAAYKAMLELSYQHHFGSAAAESTIRLGDRLLTLFRERAGASHLARVFFGNSGSDANDTAFKLVKYYHNLLGLPHKKKIISREGAYHGVSYASGSLTGIYTYHKAFDQPVDGVFHVSCPHFFRFGKDGETEGAFTARMVQELEMLIEREGADTIGAFIAEPVMGTGGVIVPTLNYFKAIQEVLNRHKILFIVDEVITGFGRTGHWFGTGAYDLKPDIVSLAKGITSAYFPVSASIISERIWDVLMDTSQQIGTFMHGFTYSGHPVGSAVAMANLDIIEQEGLVERSAELGPYLLEKLRLNIGDNPYVGDIRGAGLMVGIEFVADKAGRRMFKDGSAPHRVVARRAYENGVLTRALPFGTVNSFSPPLTITKAEIDEAVDRYARALNDALPDLDEQAA